MADSILRLKVDSQEYDNKIKRAAEGIQRYAEQCRASGGTLEHLDDGVENFVRELGKMETVSKSAKGSLSEMTRTFTELSVQYNRLTDAEKNAPFGTALKGSLDELKTRITERKSELDNINNSIGGGGGLTDSLDALAGKFGLSIKSLMGWGAALGAGTAALKVAKDAFFNNEEQLDEWGRTVESCESLYKGFLNALNTGDISGFLNNIGTITQAARDAYDALDELATFNAFNKANIAGARADLSGAIADYRENKGSKESVEQASNALIAELETRQKLQKEAYEKVVREIALQRGANPEDFLKVMTGKYGTFKELKDLEYTGTATKYTPGITPGSPGRYTEYAVPANERERLAQAIKHLNDTEIDQFQSLAEAAKMTEVEINNQRKMVARILNGIEGGSGSGGGKGGSGSGGGKGDNFTPPPVEGSIDEQTAKVQELQKAWRAAADDDSRLKIKKEIEEQQYILDRMTGKETFDPSKLNILPNIDAQKAKVEELLKAWEALANDDSRQKIKRDLEEAQAELDRMTKQKTVGITYDVSMPDVDAQTAKVDELRKAWEAVANDDSRQKIKREMEEAQDTLDRMTKQKAIGITYDVSMPDVDAQKAKVEELRKAWEALANDESRQKIKRDLEEAQAELDRMTTQKAIGITYDVSMPDVDAQTAKVEELRKAWEAVANDDSRQKIKRDLEEAQAELDRMTANVKSLKGVSIVPEIKMEDPLKRAQETLKTTRVEIEAEIKADATKVDTATLHTLLKDAIQSGIDDGLMNMTFANISDRVARGINVPDEAWQKILDQYNALREKIGMEPISLDFKTGNIDNSTKEKSSSSSLASSQKLVSGLSSVSSGLQQMGVKLPDGVQKVLGGIQGLMTVIQGVQSIISIFNTTTATAQTLTTNTNTAAMTALTSAVVANTAAITTNTITPSFFAGGGVVHAASGYVGGSHFSGDLVPALLNSGELVLNRAQQGVLASQLEGVGMGNIELKAVVSGEQLLLVQNNRGLRTGRGEIVQSRRMR